MDRTKQQATTKDLRQFGLLVGGVFAVIGLWPLVFRSESPRWWAMAIGSLLIVLGAIVPQSLQQVHGGWMKVGHILGSINTRIILGIIYYLLITPMGVIMRLMGKDPMHRVLIQDVDTYRIVRPSRPRHHMRNQF
ncbi:MAG: SxtJ family membrane protein [Nitrospira sp.]|nr:SxtJ family membrane protein [Nitrospira sp.]